MRLSRTPAPLRTPLLGGAALALAAATLVACGSGDSDPAGGGSDDLRVTFTTAPSTLDPAIACTTDDFQLIGSLYVQLLQYGSTGGPEDTTQIAPTEVEPYLAESYEASEDGLTYTFKLHDDWTFPSGEPVDAEAVKYSLERDTALAGCGYTIINDLFVGPDLIKSIEATDDTTVTIKLAKADPQFPMALASASASIVDPSLIEANGGVVKGEPNNWLASNDAGSGPFRLADYTPGASAVLEADPNFKGDPPKSKKITISYQTSASTATLNAQNGNSDVTIGLPYQSLETLQGGNTKVVEYDTPLSMLMTMPNDKAPWTDPAVREAVVRAIPTEDILKNVVAGYGDAYYGPIPPSMPGYSEEEGQPIGQDLDAAEKLMEGVDTPIAVTLDILSGDDTQKSIATIVQDTLSQIGIDVKIRSLDASAWGDAVYGGTSQAALRLDGPALFNAGYYLQYDESCASDFNVGHICVDGNTKLLEQARGATDESDRDADYAQITKNWVEAYPRVTFYNYQATVVLSNSVTSFYYSPMIDMRTWGK